MTLDMNERGNVSAPWRRRRVMRIFSSDGKWQASGLQALNAEIVGK